MLLWAFARPALNGTNFGPSVWTIAILVLSWVSVVDSYDKRRLTDKGEIMPRHPQAKARLTRPPETKQERQTRRSTHRINQAAALAAETEAQREAWFASIDLDMISVVTKSGSNVTLACPGITEQSLVHELEWKLFKSNEKLVNLQSETVIEKQPRISLNRNNSALMFYPALASDTEDYICLFNSNPKPEAIVRLIVQDVPDPPSQPLILNFTARTVNLSWAPSSNSHYSDVSHFIIHTRVGENGPWDTVNVITTKDNSSTFQLDNLHPYTVYSFRVLAVNSMGASHPSKESFYIWTLREIPIGRPTIAIAHNISANAIHISWRAPPLRSIQGEFLGYRITYKPRGAASNMQKELYVRDPKADSHTIENLQTYTQYMVTLQVFNPEGLGPVTKVLVMTDEGGDLIGPYLIGNCRYRNMISQFLSPQLDGMDTDNLWFQQDGATRHTAH